MRLWEALGGFGRFCKALKALQGFVRLWAVLRGFERFWEALGGFVMFLEALDGFVMLWEALALEGFGKLLKSLGRPWLQHSMSLTEALGSFGSL